MSGRLGQHGDGGAILRRDRGGRGRSPGPAARHLGRDRARAHQRNRGEHALEGGARLHALHAAGRERRRHPTRAAPAEGYSRRGYGPRRALGSGTPGAPPRSIVPAPVERAFHRGERHRLRFHPASDSLRTRPSKSPGTRSCARPCFAASAMASFHSTPRGAQLRRPPCASAVDRAHTCPDHVFRAQEASLPGVITASPGGKAMRDIRVSRIRRHAARISGPPARWIAPSTPPPPRSEEFAAFTIRVDRPRA